MVCAIEYEWSKTYTVLYELDKTELVKLRVMGKERLPRNGDGVLRHYLIKRKLEQRRSPNTIALMKLHTKDLAFEAKKMGATKFYVYGLPKTYEEIWRI